MERQSTSLNLNVVPPWGDIPLWAKSSSLSTLHDHTQTHTHTQLGRTPLDKRSARRSELYLTTHSGHGRKASTPPLGFEHANPASERPQTQALDIRHTIVTVNRVRKARQTNTFAPQRHSAVTLPDR